MRIGIDDTVQLVRCPGKSASRHLVVSPIYRSIRHDITGRRLFHVVDAYVGIESRVESQLLGQTPLHAHFNRSKNAEFQIVLSVETVAFLCPQEFV